MTFGERLYKLRNGKNISQEERAELLDVSRQSVSKWENNKAYPEMTRLLFMSDYFQVSLDYLMRGTGEEGHLTKSNSAVPETTPEQKETLQQETSGAENTAESGINYQVNSLWMLWNDLNI